jgi:carboxymethylenebutenolidase
MGAGSLTDWSRFSVLGRSAPWRRALLRSRAMDIASRWITLDDNGTPLPAYASRPARAASALPGIVVLQEAWGVERHLRDVCDRLATAGYQVVAPSLYARSAPPELLADERADEVKAFLDRSPRSVWFDPAARRQALDALGPSERERLSAALAVFLRQDRPWSEYVACGRCAAAWLLAGPSKGKKIGSIGFCMGGAVSAQLAANEPALSAAVIFYGMSPPAQAAASIACPVLGIYGEKDGRVNAGVPAFAEAMKNAGKRFDSETYAGADHAFFNDTRSSYDADAARLAWARTLGFFAAALGRGLSV